MVRYAETVNLVFKPIKNDGGDRDLFGKVSDSITDNTETKTTPASITPMSLREQLKTFGEFRPDTYICRIRNMNKVPNEIHYNGLKYKPYAVMRHSTRSNSRGVFYLREVI